LLYKTENQEKMCPFFYHTTAPFTDNTKRLKIKIFTLILLFLIANCCIDGLFAQNSSIVREQFATLGQIATYIEFPDKSGMNDQSTPCIIGIFGDKEWEPFFKDLYASTTIMRKRVIVKTISNIAEIENCNFLYIPNSQKSQLGNIIRVTKDKPIITIGDTEGFGKQGVLVNFIPEKHGKNIEINDTAAKAALINFDFRLFVIAADVY